MRAVFLVLLLANAAFFVWARYWPSSGTEVEGVVARRNEPGRLRIVPASEAAPPAATTSCFEWGSFTLAEYSRAEKALEPLALGSRLAQRRVEPAPGWWVYIPPQGSRQGALKKAAELKALGVNDYFILGEEQDPPWALSLGLYRSEPAAQARLASLRDQGVRSALVGPRDNAVPRYWLQVKAIDPALEPRLRELAAGLQGSELRACAER